MNKIFVRGNLAMDPEFREVRVKDVTKRVCKILIISSERNKADNEEKILFVAKLWEKQAERVASLGKGDGVFATGRLKEEEWKDKDGNLRKNVALIVESIDALARAPRRETSATPDWTQQRQPTQEEHVLKVRKQVRSYEEDDLPF